MENRSIWEDQSFFNQDIIIVGGGIIGLFIGFQILQESPKTKLLILERGIIPTGASLKNLGIICCADIPGLIDDMNAYGKDYVVEDARERFKGIQEYKRLFDQESIGFVENGFYEFFYEHELAFLDQVDSFNKLLYPVFNDNVFEIRNEKIKEFGMNTDIFKGALYNKFEACLDSGKLIRTLISKVSALGGLYLTGSNVISHKKLNEDITEVHVLNPLSETTLKFTCNKLVYSINGFAKRQFPDVPLTSGKGQIICSKPIDNLQKFTGTYANDFYYFRVMNNRLMLGGGSRIDFKKADVFDLKNSDSVIKHLKREIGKSFPQIEFDVEFEWNGLMAFSNDPKKMYQEPMIKILEDNVILVCRLCGNGVSIAPLLSKKIQTMLQAKIIKKDEAKL